MRACVCVPRTQQFASELFRSKFARCNHVIRRLSICHGFIATGINCFFRSFAQNPNIERKNSDSMCDVLVLSVHCYCYRLLLLLLWLQCVATLNPVHDTGLVGSHLRKWHAVAVCVCHKSLPQHGLHSLAVSLAPAAFRTHTHTHNNFRLCFM